MSFPYHKLMSLKPNWDGYGAVVPEIETIIHAACVHSGLSGAGWQVVPMTDGGVQIERHANGFDVEITVQPSNRATPEMDVHQYGRR